MKKLLVLCTSLVLCSCASTKTPLQQCIDDDSYVQFGGMGECIAEVTAERTRRKQQWASGLATFGRGLQQNAQQPRQLNCTSRTSFGTTYTECY